jgi:predicted thioesterase
MKSSLQPGVSRVAGIVVDSGRAISFMGEAARVYATPSMILDIERTCRELLMEHADPGEDSVGMEVSVKHLAATLMGTTVEITATVAAVEGRKITFEVAARDEIEPICAGTHIRFVVDTAKTFERLKAKAEKLAEKRAAKRK